MPPRSLHLAPVFFSFLRDHKRKGKLSAQRNAITTNERYIQKSSLGLELTSEEKKTCRQAAFIWGSVGAVCPPILGTVIFAVPAYYITKKRFQRQKFLARENKRRINTEALVQKMLPQEIKPLDDPSEHDKAAALPAAVAQPLTTARLVRQEQSDLPPQAPIPFAPYVESSTTFVRDCRAQDPGDQRTPANNSGIYAKLSPYNDASTDDAERTPLLGPQSRVSSNGLPLRTSGEYNTPTSII